MIKESIWLLFVMLLACSGCSNNIVVKENHSRTGVLRIETQVEYVDKNYKHLQKQYFPKDVVLAFPYVAAGIFGRPDSEPLFVERLNEELSFSLDLVEKRKAIKNGSQPLVNKWLELGLSITPADTRLSRLATLPYDAITQKPVGGGGFINPSSRNRLILIYVDRACEIQGELDLSEGHYIHQLVLPTDGYFWLEISKTPEGTSVLSVYPDDGEVHFFIKIYDLLAV